MEKADDMRYLALAQDAELIRCRHFVPLERARPLSLRF
jgi:hypothetical protein